MNNYLKIKKQIKLLKLVNNCNYMYFNLIDRILFSADA